MVYFKKRNLLTPENTRLAEFDFADEMGAWSFVRTPINPAR